MVVLSQAEIKKAHNRLCGNSGLRVDLSRYYYSITDLKLLRISSNVPDVAGYLPGHQTLRFVLVFTIKMSSFYYTG